MYIWCYLSTKCCWSVGYYTNYCIWIGTTSGIYSGTMNTFTTTSAFTMR